MEHGSTETTDDFRVVASLTWALNPPEDNVWTTPLQEAAYDFEVPLTVSGVRWTAADVSSFSLTASSSSSCPPARLGPMSAGNTRHVVKPQSVTMATPLPLRIQATGGEVPVEGCVCVSGYSVASDCPFKH